MMEEQQKHPEASGSLTLLLTSLATACKATEAAVRKAGTKISIIALSGMIDLSNRPAHMFTTKARAS